MPLIINILLLIAGAILLTGGSNYFIEGAARIAKRLGISHLVIGATLVALGTSLPEFFVSFVSAIKNIPSISIGNIVGSNICNIALILGITALVRPLSTSSYVLKFEYPLLFITSLLLFIFSLNGIIGRWEAIIYIFMLVYFIRNYYKKLPQDDSLKDKNIDIYSSILLTVGGLLALLIGSELFIKAAVNIAKTLGVSELVIGLSLVALGTSLPELASTIAATLKRKEEIALGNVIGSNILNMLFIVGTVSFIKPIKTQLQLIKIDIPFMIGLTVLLFAVIKWKGKVDRRMGILFVILYFMYIIIIFKIGRIGR